MTSKNLDSERWLPKFSLLALDLEQLQHGPTRKKILKKVTGKVKFISPYILIII